MMALIVIVALTLGAALAVAMLPNPVHCGLSAAAAFAGFGCLFLALGAEFLGFIQILVYVGAVAILIMFVILLTRPREAGRDRLRVHGLSSVPGIVVALAVLGVLVWSILGAAPVQPSAAPSPSDVAFLGEALVSDYAAPLLAVGVLLTVALVGGVLFAFDNDPE